MVIIQEYEGSH